MESAFVLCWMRHDLDTARGEHFGQALILARETRFGFNVAAQLNKW